MIQSRKRRALYKRERNEASTRTIENDEGRTSQRCSTPPTGSKELYRRSLQHNHGHNYFCRTCRVGFRRQKAYLEHTNGRKHKQAVADWNSSFQRYATEVPTWKNRRQPTIQISIPGLEKIARSGCHPNETSVHESSHSRRSIIHFETKLADESFRSEQQDVVVVEEVTEDEEAVVDVCSPWRAEEWKDFPHRSSCIDPSLLVSTIGPQLRGRFWRYLKDTFGKHYPELTSIFHRVSVTHPQYMRIKELFETLEAFQLVSNIILLSEKSFEKTPAGPKIDTIYDMACGHGLLGILLAYRFPTKSVVCVDLQERPSFYAFRDAFVSEGESSLHETEILSNLDYREEDLSCSRDKLTSTSCLVAVHACNEANKTVVDMANDAGATWAVLPCCIRSKLYLGGAPVLDVDGDTRYQLLCGAFAEASKASMLRSISREITARPILIAGGFETSERQKETRNNY